MVFVGSVACGFNLEVARRFIIVCKLRSPTLGSPHTRTRERCGKRSGQKMDDDTFFDSMIDKFNKISGVRTTTPMSEGFIIFAKRRFMFCCLCRSLIRWSSIPGPSRGKRVGPGIIFSLLETYELVGGAAPFFSIIMVGAWAKILLFF